MLLIELIHAGRVVPGTREEIHDYLHQQDYVYLATIGQLEITKTETLMPSVMIFLGADDVFVRRDLLRSKYMRVDYEAAEQYSWFCKHYLDSNCALTTIGWRSSELPSADRIFFIFIFL